MTNRFPDGNFNNNTVCEDTKATPTINVISAQGDGGFYAEASEYWTRRSADFQPGPGNGALGLSESGKLGLGGVMEWFEQVPNDDGSVGVRFWGPGQWDMGTWIWGSTFHWVFLEPFQYAFVSFGLLKPRLKHYNARIVPYICPYVDVAGFDQLLGNVSTAVKTAINGGATNYIALKRNDEARITLGKNNSKVNLYQGAKPVHAPDYVDPWSVDWRQNFELEPEGTYTVYSALLPESLFIYITWLIGFILPAIIVFILLILIFMLRNVFLKQYRRMLSLLRQEEIMKKEVSRAGEAEDAFDEDEEEDNDVLDAENAVPPPLLKVLEELIVTRLDSVVEAIMNENSLKSFLAQKCKYTPGEQERLSVIQASYERFCQKTEKPMMRLRDKITGDATFTIGQEDREQTDCEIFCANQLQEIFIHLRWQTPMEKASQESAGAGGLLSSFIHCECMVTKLDHDFVVKSTFEDRFTEFCNEQVWACE